MLIMKSSPSLGSAYMVMLTFLYIMRLGDQRLSFWWLETFFCCFKRSIGLSAFISE
jgi:hypothetical protein